MAHDEIEIVAASGALAASVTPPGSKSITNRALLLAAMADGRSELSGALVSDDTRQMAGALRSLGIVVRSHESLKRIIVLGAAGRIPKQAAELNIGGAGTAMRFLAGFVTLGWGKFRIDGSAQMRTRPIGDLVDALRALGLKVTCERDGYPPVTIEAIGPEALGKAVSLNAERSSQFVSALLLPAPLWRDGLELHVRGVVARPFIEMTLKMMALWGARADYKGDSITIAGGQSYAPRDFVIEPDASSASYFAAAAALCGGSIRLNGITRNSVQGDVGFLDVLQRIGAEVSWHLDHVEVIGSRQLRGIEIDMGSMPDMVPTLAVLAPFASGETVIRNVAFIRHHESDRITALAMELRRLGADVEELPDGLRIAPSRLKPATVDPHDDHRIAMSFAVAGLKVGGIRIANPSCVEKTYPEFFSDLTSVSDTK